MPGANRDAGASHSTGAHERRAKPTHEPGGRPIGEAEAPTTFGLGRSMPTRYLTHQSAAPCVSCEAPLAGLPLVCVLAVLAREPVSQTATFTDTYSAIWGIATGQQSRPMG